ncbi:MAG: hypothetical protein IT221_04100 [Fluviicola sp.]|nr:hypothetical protein [Fluviicola sp.]
MSKRLFFIGFFLLQLFQQNSYGASPFFGENVQFKNFSMKSGLPSDNCFKTVQTANGCIWVAGVHGIGRFNGFQWTYFQQEANLSQRLTSNWVMDIQADGNNLWFHTDRGSGFIASQNKVVFPKNKHLGWGKLLVTKQKAYIGSWKGIVMYSKSNKGFHTPKVIHGSENQSCIQLVAHRKQLVGIFEDVPGYFTVNPNNIQLALHPKIVLDGQATAIYIYHYLNQGNRLLASTKSHGIISLDPKTGTAYTLIDAKELGTKKTTQLAWYKIQKQLYLIIGTEGNGVFIYQKGKGIIGNLIPKAELPSTSICSSIIQHIFVDQNNGIWFSTDKGLSYLHPSLQRFKPFYFFRNPSIPENTTLNAIRDIGNNNYLIGTDQDGCFWYHSPTEKAEKLTLPTSNDWKTIVGICQIDDDHFAIAGLRSWGIFTLSTKNFKEIKGIDSQLFGIRLLNKQQIGIGTGKGAVIYDQLSNTYIFKEKNLKNLPYSELFCKDLWMDPKGNLWILRFFNGLEVYHFQSKSYKQLTPQSIINQGTDFHNLAVSTNNVYVASSSGLFCYNWSNEQLSNHFTSKNGLIGDIIDRCEVTTNGKELYYTTPTGLYRLNKTEKKSYLLHPLEKYRQKWFNDLHLTSSNELLLTASNYFAKYAISEAEYAQPDLPTLESFMVNGKNLTLSPKITLKPGQDNVAITFQRTNFSDNGELIIEYKIPELKNVFTPIKEGELELMGLTAGNYTIQFRTRNQATGICSPVKQLELFLASPFYLRWWFSVLIIGVIALLIYTYFQIRLKNKERLMHTRIQLSRDLHDELGANVSSIQIMANLLENATDSSDPKHAFVSNISTYSKQINENINDIIWNVNPRFDDLNELILRMKRYAGMTLEAAEITVEFKEPSQELHFPIDQTSKYFIYLIFKESVNNCAKYSQAHNCRIQFILDKKYIGFELVDDGIGFDLELAKKNGNGLFNMYKRAAEIHAELSIQTQPQSGCTITLKKIR